jgi:hypothetical protein
MKQLEKLANQEKGKKGKSKPESIVTENKLGERSDYGR